TPQADAQGDTKADASVADEIPASDDTQDDAKAGTPVADETPASGATQGDAKVDAQDDTKADAPASGATQANAPVADETPASGATQGDTPAGTPQADAQDDTKADTPVADETPASGATPAGTPQADAQGDAEADGTDGTDGADDEQAITSEQSEDDQPLIDLQLDDIEENTAPSTDESAGDPAAAQDAAKTEDPTGEGFNLEAESLVDKFNFSDDDDIFIDDDEEDEVDSDSVSDFSGSKGVSPTDDIISQDDYDLFLKNLNEYPLNLRIEIEKLIVENEFTEEVVSTVFKKVLKKTSAVALADYIGGLLGIAIDVPHNFEKRSADQYEAYKASAGYQLKSRIIPALIMLLLLGLGGWFSARMVNQFVIRPILAHSAYKEGYVLLQNKFYPQSELKFLDGLAYNPSKKWMFAYADGYREEKQFDRARKMYERGLAHYPNDKQFGLQYAQMELYDLSNYEKAEEIVRRKVLDSFVNDKDGVLLLGDIFLEWATDVDPSKFEQAFTQYTFLIDEYGSNDLYQSRMMRYFVRTDNLREVIQLKGYFLPNEKSLGANDLVELSEYLLDKQYGQLKPADEYLRWYIEDVRTLLERAITANPRSADAQYNLSRYFVETKNRNFMEQQLQFTLRTFDNAEKRTRKHMLKNVDTYRMLGEYYVTNEEYLQAEQQFMQGLLMFEGEALQNGVKANKNIGKLYEDMANIDYFVSGDLAQALRNYENATKSFNDSASIRYKIGYIQYSNKDFSKALDSFVTAFSEKTEDKNLLLALGNTHYLRENSFAAQGFYEELLDTLQAEKSRLGIMFPQTNPEEHNFAETFMKATNNYGVTLHKLAARTGDSSKNALAMVQLSESTRAWDALTRNTETMVRLAGSNLAEQNIRYISAPLSSFEPEIYIDIPRTVDHESYFRR
ncbi:MAG: periplasmic flagellar collar protein FlcA, partial [Treponemataceae bacterium]